MMVLIAGHRGARDLWPENSLLGFRNLRGLGVDAVEFDIHQSVDGGLVVIHDPLLDRTAHDTGPVGLRTLKQLTATRLREAGDECIPALDDVLDVFSASSLELHIEIKTDAFGYPYPGIEGRLVDAVKRHGLAQRAVLTCFVPGAIEIVRRLCPQARVLVPDCIVAVEKSLLSLTLPLALKVLGRERLGAWVTNEPQEIAHWLTQPVRQITTDRPDLALNIRRGLTSAPAPA
jgi:glycerophosphoryl diester phosphodiesterase